MFTQLNVPRMSTTFYIISGVSFSVLFLDSKGLNQTLSESPISKRNMSQIHRHHQKIYWDTSKNHMTLFGTPTYLFR